MQAMTTDTTFDADDAFAELQETLDDAKEASKRLEELNALCPTDTIYQQIRGELLHCKDPDSATREEIKALTSQWYSRFDELSTREDELIDALAQHGHDVTGWLRETHIKPNLAHEDDPSLRARVDVILDQMNPVEKLVGEVGERVQQGASGYAGIDDDKALAHVDVLEGGQDGMDDVMECDRPVDEMRIFDDTADAQGIEEPVRSVSSGAHWVDGFRISPEIMATLKPHQTGAVLQALPRIAAKKGTLIAHAPGLGKTLTLLALFASWLDHQPQSRMLLLCPKSMLSPWVQEAMKWHAAKVLDVDTYAITQFDDIFLRKQMSMWTKHGGMLLLQADQYSRVLTLCGNFLTSDDILAVDEAHLLRSQNTQIYATIQASTTTRRVFLTGTPLQNALDEYYALIELLEPGLLGKTPADFRKRFGNVIDAGMHKDSTDAEVAASGRMTQIMRWQVNHVMHDRTAAILQVSIPDKTEFRISHMCEKYQPDANPIVERHRVHDASRDHKVFLMCELYKHISQTSNESVVVFSSRLENLQAACAALPGLMFTGQSNTDQRTQILSQFEQSGGVLYVSTKAGGLGINITCASRVILLDVSWNPVDDEQAVARCYRMGQTLPVIVYRFVAADSLEDRVYRTSVQKHMIATRILNEQDIQRTYTRTDLAHDDFEEPQPELTLKDLWPLDVPLTQLKAKLSSTVSVFTHEDKTLGDAQLSAADMNEALNEFHDLQSKTSRTLRPASSVDESAAQLVAVGQIMFQEPHAKEIVPAYTPHHRFTSDRDIIIDNAGPADECVVQYQRVDPACTRDDFLAANGLWQTILVSPVQGKIRIQSNSNGAFFFRMCCVVGGQRGPWSDVSSPVVV